MTDEALRQARVRIARVVEGGQRPPCVRGFFHDGSNTISYVIWDEGTRRAAIIDGVLDFDSALGRTGQAQADQIIELVVAEGLCVEWLLETHVHADHLSSVPYLQHMLGGTCAISASIVDVQRTFGPFYGECANTLWDGSDFDRLLRDGDCLPLGGLSGIALQVPGHTPADMAFVFGDCVFVGDTLFMPDAGTARADFPGGDPHQLYRSVRRLLDLPDQTKLFLCHDYKAPGRDEFCWQTTVADQRASNIHVRDGVEEADFVALRRSRDAALPMPKLILPAIQVNMRGGRLPEPDEEGKQFLRLPINAF